MRHEWATVHVDGFSSGEVDFAARLAAADQSVRDELDATIIGPLINAVDDGAILVIDGHSDRVDTGQDHRTSLELERVASMQRAKSASDAILMLIRRDWLDPGPTDWSDLPHLAVMVTWSGATFLRADPVDESDRLKNRRVTFELCRMIPEE